MTNETLNINLYYINSCFHTVFPLFFSKILTDIWCLDFFLLWYSLKNGPKQLVLQLGGIRYLQKNTQSCQVAGLAILASIGFLYFCTFFSFVMKSVMLTFDLATNIVYSMGCEVVPYHGVEDLSLPSL